MNKKILLSLILSNMIFHYSCKVSGYDIDKQELESHFQTKNIESEFIGKTLKVFISNSGLIDKAKEIQDVKWVTYESYASIGAFVTFENNTKICNEIDSIYVSIKMGNKEETYQYSVSDLREIKPLFKISKDFLFAWVSKDYTKGQALLSDEINNTYPTIDDLKNALSTVFLEVSIDNANLIAFKVHEGIVGLYINAYYDNNEAQTYLVNFYISGDSKIAGISVP